MTELEKPYPLILTLKNGSTHNYKPSYNIKSAHYHHSTKLDNASILNLDKYKDTKDTINKPNYDAFKSFTNRVVEKLANEIDNNKGEIIQAHIFNQKYTTQIDTMCKEYEKTYIITITKTDTHKTTTDGKLYPFFMEDLNSKNSVIYEEFEKNVGITTKIEDQTDEEFLDTLGKRIEGLNQCKLDHNYNEKSKKYFSNEYEKKKDRYDKINEKKKKRKN